MGIIPLLYAQLNSINPFLTYPSFCKIRVYVNQVSAMSCRWLLVMACIDRCFTCSVDAGIRRIFPVKTSRCIALGLIGIWLLLPIHTLIFVDIIPPGNIACVVIHGPVSIYHGLYTLILGGILPPIIMLICTFFIRESLKIKNQRLVSIRLAGLNRRNAMRDQQVILILLAQVAIFVISTIPFMANNLYGNLTRHVRDKSQDRLAIESFVGVITEVFVYVYPASTFYSNTLISRTFRRELAKMSKQVCRPSRRVTPTVNTLSQKPSPHGQLYNTRSDPRGNSIAPTDLFRPSYA